MVTSSVDSHGWWENAMDGSCHFANEERQRGKGSKQSERPTIYINPNKNGYITNVPKSLFPFILAHTTQESTQKIWKLENHEPEIPLEKDEDPKGCANNISN